MERTAGGVRPSLPGQKGQELTKDGFSPPATLCLKSEGLFRLSVAIINHSLVVRSCLISDTGAIPYSLKNNLLHVKFYFPYFTNKISFLSRLNILKVLKNRLRFRVEQQVHNEL
jgi:hypothetical protein